MDFGILGRTQVVTDGREVALGGSQRRSLLAVLLVDARAVVPAERLIDALWPLGPPMSAAQTVQSHVSHLRKLLGTDRIETASGGYRLLVEDAEVDAAAFERDFELGRIAAATGDAGASVTLLDTGLGRWRGRALEDADGCERAAAESARLEGLRTSALELLLDGRLALGQHDRVAADAEAAVAQWPLRERLWASLVVALYRCGRHADALSAYQRLRSTLAEQLGLDPSPSLVDLEARILRHDPTLLLPTRGPSARRTGNLPGRTTSFIGRDRETQRVRGALSAAPLVTLTGVGGVGKTRLAVHVAETLGPTLEDGAWLCELAAVDSPEALVQVVAATLGVQSRAGVDLTEALVDFLRAKQLLLVLDNCEHLLTSAGDLAEVLLASCPDLRVLATSREGLAVEGEQVMPLRSLELPPLKSEPAVMAAADAVRLFVERATAAGADLSLEGDELAAVADICRRLDGVPLALELAAARAAGMSPADIAVHLDERFRLLTGGRRNAVERHQTLRAAVDWSYGSLSDRDRAVFDRLGVFAGGFDLASAQGVVAADGVSAFDTVDALSSLVAKSMVVADHPVGGAARYRLLETIRQYARDRLDESGVADVWRRRHATYFVGLAEQAGPGFRGPDEIMWRARISEELDNLRAAVNWALDREDAADAQLGIRIIVSLVIEGMVRRSSGVGTWTLRALERRPELSLAQLYEVRTGAAWDLFQSGDVPAALDMAREAVAGGVPAGVTYTAGPFVALATSSAMLGDLEGARIAYRAGREASEGRDDERFSLAVLLSAEAMNLAGAGETPEARRCAEEALQVAREVRNPTALVLANFGVGWALSTEDPASARSALEECITLSNAGAIDGSVGGALARLAPLRLRAGEPIGAIDALLTGFARLREVGDRTSLTNVIDASAIVLADLGSVPAAVLAYLLVERTGVPTAHSEIEAGRRSATLARLRSEDPQLLEAATRRSDQLSTDEVLDLLVQELNRLRTTISTAPEPELPVA